MLLHELQRLKKLLLDLLWIRLNSLVVSILHFEPYLVLVLALQDKSTYIHLASSLVELLGGILEILLLLVDLI